MKTDIVERLRSQSILDVWHPMMLEAADEIEKLRAASKQCDEAMAGELGGEPIDTLMIEARRAARAAYLGEKND